MYILQSIDYKKITKAELEKQKEKLVAEKLKMLLPDIDITINIDYKMLEKLEKALQAFQALAEKVKGIYQTEFDEQFLIYQVSVISTRFTLESYDLYAAFQDIFSKDSISISPATDGQGTPCVCITKQFLF